nr:collagen alpha-1(I) chain-like [Globicephala melas]
MSAGAGQELKPQCRLPSSGNLGRQCVAQRGILHPHPKEEPREPENRGSNPQGTYLGGPGPPERPSQAEAPPDAATPFGAGGEAGRPGAPGVRPGSRGVRLLCSHRVLRPPHLGCRRTAAELRAPRWVRRKVLRQGGPGSPRCGEKCVPGKPLPAAEGRGARS